MELPATGILLILACAGCRCSLCQEESGPRADVQRRFDENDALVSRTFDEIDMPYKDTSYYTKNI